MGALSGAGVVMAMRRAGQRRHWIELQSVPTRTATSTGFAGTWTTYARGWASVEPAPAGQTERSIANTTDATITHLVETDYVEDVRISHRVRMVDTGALLYIVGVPQNVEMRNRALIIPCEERAA